MEAARWALLAAIASHTTITNPCLVLHAICLAFSNAVQVSSWFGDIAHYAEGTMGGAAWPLLKRQQVWR